MEAIKKLALTLNKCAPMSGSPRKENLWGRCWIQGRKKRWVTLARDAAQNAVANIWFNSLCSLRTAVYPPSTSGWDWLLACSPAPCEPSNELAGLPSAGTDRGTRVCTGRVRGAQQTAATSVNLWTRRTAGGAGLQQLGYLLQMLSLMKILHNNRKSFLSLLTFRRMRSLIINFPWQSTPFFCKNGIPVRAQCCLVYISSCFSSASQNMLIYFYEASWKLHCSNLFYVLIWKKDQYITWPSLQLYYICYHLLNGLILSSFASKVVLT